MFPQPSAVRVAYGYTQTSQDDLRDGKVEYHHEGKTRRFMEPAFVPRTADADEDDGWILAYLWDESTNKSDVVILHAQDFSAGPLATIHLPARVPFGFHGNWVPDSRS